MFDHPLPAHARHEALFEGRDGSLTEHLVVNPLTEDGVMNLKVLWTRAFAVFAELTPSADPDYLENLENYDTMQLLHDPRHALAGSRGACGHAGTAETPTSITSRP